MEVADDHFHQLVGQAAKEIQRLQRLAQNSARSPAAVVGSASRVQEIIEGVLVASAGYRHGTADVCHGVQGLA